MQSKVIPLDVIKHILELNHDLSTMREDNIPLSQISTYLRTKEREIKDKNLNSGTQGKPPIYYIKYLHN